jgi:hypothetical protein
MHQRLPHQPPAHPVPAGQRPDRQPLPPPITPDALEQLSLRGRHQTHLTPPSTTRLPRSTRPAGPLQAGKGFRHPPPARAGPDQAVVATCSAHGPYLLMVSGRSSPGESQSSVSARSMPAQRGRRYADRYFWARHPEIAGGSVHHVHAVSSRATPSPPSRRQAARSPVAATRFATASETQKALSRLGRGLDLRKLVAGAGFEPATSGL